MVKPVSFGSLMVFTIDDEKPKLPIPEFLKLSFNNNPNLKDYTLTDTFEYKDDTIDGTVHNAAKNFAEFLDKKHKSKLPKGSKDVILTKANFFVNPKDVQERYFLTAANDNEEEKIHNILSNSSDFYVAKFGYKA